MYLKVFKRIFDILIGLVGIIFFVFPAMLVLLVFYSFGKNKGSMFFSQERLGLNGRLFKIYKFRSMVVNSEEILAADQQLYQKYVANSYKLSPEEDPRLTWLGVFIRKYSIDEFPQFWNILKGDMSLIGPRPIVPKELNEYQEADRPVLLSVKPGAFGWWQVSGRSEITYPERCEVELYYARNISLRLDWEIFIKSFGKVFKGTGAH